MEGSLSGIKIIDLSRLLPGPYCSMILADHGADVISIESKRFQSDDLYFKILNRNKKHMSLNLKTNEGKKIFFKLVETSDVIIEGFRPGVCKKLGIDYETVKKINHRIIYCSITGYGQTGPWKDRPGHDINYLSRSGVLSLIGESEKPPTILSHRYACYNTYETSDKRYLAVGALENRFWKNLCNHFGKPEYIPLQYDDEHRVEIIAYMKDQFIQKNLSCWVDELQHKEVCLTGCATLEEALADPLFKERGMVVAMKGTNGAPVQMIGVPVKLSKTPGKIKTLPVDFGENTTSLLEDFGYFI